jgi:hypothetical protein
MGIVDYKRGYYDCIQQLKICFGSSRYVTKEYALKVLEIAQIGNKVLNENKEKTED